MRCGDDVPRVDLIHLHEQSGRYQRHSKKRIKAQWNHVCAYCGYQGSAEKKDITLDHVIPKAKGGPTVRANLVPACRRCNVSKSDRDFKDWYRHQSFFNANFESAILRWMGQ